MTQTSIVPVASAVLRLCICMYSLGTDVSDHIQTGYPSLHHEVSVITLTTLSWGHSNTQWCMYTHVRIDNGTHCYYPVL